MRSAQSQNYSYSGGCNALVQSDLVARIHGTHVLFYVVMHPNYSAYDTESIEPDWLDKTTSSVAGKTNRNVCSESFGRSLYQ